MNADSGSLSPKDSPRDSPKDSLGFRLPKQFRIRSCSKPPNSLILRNPKSSLVL